MASNFDDLLQSLPGTEIYVPGELGYEESLKRWSASCIKPAAVVVRPTTAAEVSVALRYATEHSILPLAICGGGHSTSGDSASDGGMVIDLFQMRSTTVDIPKQTISFGGGCTWEDVNGALWEHGLGTVSGVVGDTGVGGLILGGGYGYLTGRRGLALDCLLGCEVVLANGDVVTANKDENADLFWALRGAGPNFGIVTRFTSQAYPQGDCWAGFLAYLPNKLTELIEFGNIFMKTTDGNSMLSIIVGNFIPPDRDAGLLAVVFYNGTKKEGQDFFKPLYDLEPIGDTTATLPYTEVNLMFNKHPRTPKDRHLFGGANFTLPLNATHGTQIAEHFWRTTRLPENEALKGSTLTFEYHPTHQIRQVAVEDTAFGNRGQFSSICITMNWTDETRDADARSLSRFFSQHIATKTGFKGDKYSDGTGSYANYFSNKTKAEKVFGSNTARLRELKQKYDPTCVFKKVLDLSPDVNGY
ncbi:hypothetical protein N7494_007590 [Penicillium frequentans]|uniref:FAD-binding PCMH-type domain-containing protein n=1 Tax=Penicillium frequentans TaxID=3151616 RepID=A0AAD6CSS6_9EURO|nr:hypothetical protein N7494_007590 [Penicillium glabrum]